MADADAQAARLLAAELDDEVADCGQLQPSPAPRLAELMDRAARLLVRLANRIEEAP